MSPVSLIPIGEGSSIDTAERVRKVSNHSAFHYAVLTEDEFITMDIPPRESVMKGLILEKTITIVNGWRGIGKSFLCQSIANEITWGEGIGPWVVEKPMNVLFVDGEMPLELLQERFKLLNAGRDLRRKAAHLYFYPESYAYRIGLHRADILNEAWRQSVSSLVEGLNIGFLMLDNLSSLAPGIDENDKTMFDPVNRWLLELRFSGVTIMMAHHTGKGGEQRGTSAHEDHVDTALLVSKARNAGGDKGCKFVLTATKDRAFITKGMTAHCELVREPRTGRLLFAVGDGTAKKDIVLLNPNMTRTEARAIGISDRTYYRHRPKSKNNE